MKRIIRVLAIILYFLILSGCNKEIEHSKETADKSNEDIYIPVQEYTGEGYKLDNGEETERIAKENRAVVEKAVQRFFKEEYKTEITVHNIVGNVDGATVFVESVGEPHFYTYAIIPIDVENEEVLEEDVWSQQNQVEDAITTGLYAYAHQQQFDELNTFIDSIANDFNLTGKTTEAIKNVGGAGFATNYYFIQIADEQPFKEILNTYIEQPNIDQQSWYELFKNTNFKPESFLISIKLFTKDNQKPEQELLDTIANKLEETDNLPRGAYSIILNDNLVNKNTGIGEYENSIERSYPNDIVKE
ncbi:DUF1672 family protein [Gracilibacillus saliphilus]|uniref:DUF1672 family protein n=1 Tax=Gracilibacillus saliphilus TaxID=543890 RepID=UPI001EE26EBB|nr:DUF1672 family protein [Gracilibacillus saliphilus]